MAEQPIRLTGLKELNQELRKLDATFPKAVRQVNWRVAENVAQKARSSAESQGGVIAKAAPSIKAMAQQARAQVKIGGERYPYALGGEFGSVQYPQFKAWRGSGGDAGYALYPALRSERSEIERTYLGMIDEVTRAAFPN